MVDLSTLLSSTSDLVLLVVSNNDRGEIAGVGTDVNGNGHAIVLVPCDENHPGLADCVYGLMDTENAAQPRTPQAAQFSTAKNGNHTKVLRDRLDRRLIGGRRFSDLRRSNN
jgi:hypothetical protein